MSDVSSPVDVENPGCQLPPVHHYEIPQQTHFIAVRKGDSIQNCIFQNWDDAKHHLEGPDAQYSIFDSIDDAIKFAFNNDDDDNTHLDAIDDSVEEDTILESMTAENLMEQILPSTTNLLRMPQVHDDFISLAHDAAAAMGRDEHIHLGLTDQVPHETHESVGANDADIGGHGVQESEVDSNTCTVLPNVSLQITDPQPLEPSPLGINRESESTTRRRKRGVKRKDCEEKTRHRDTRRDMEWNEKYNLLVHHLAQHGTSTVPNKPENNALTTWINAQKTDYRKLQQTGTSKLTASQVQRLNDVGLKFTAKRRYASWDQRLEQLKTFKEANGHARVPVNHPDLGSWVHDQRRQYKLYINNDPKTKMTQEKLQQMIHVGFIFEVAKKSQQYDSRSNAKSWEDRFEELKDFKETFGHTIVPQHYPNLGWWVNTQRKERKKLKAGKKTSLTIERCLKLTEIGFVFDASNKRASTNYAYEEMQREGEVQRMV